ncbi:hypothetical protein AJ80_05092 [Polytolypa hystricis UAMH7299]|uniref:Alpha-1,2-mannosyltransferase n=1 Tax=Polytolypa hystricis (strain UAMH7299) TaxID=1447883 RepID=A0A2B7Y840_POLH7|nr:hypothetical protein AJ80_05092 [Polytolypa hystricis UAMH7299]
MHDSITILGFAAALTAIIYHLISTRRRIRLATLLGIRDEGYSHSTTLQRSLSLKKQGREDLIYRDSFPPLRRQFLTTVGASHISQKPAELRHDATANVEDVKEALLPMTCDYRADDQTAFTPTGFSLSEIQMLGDFPDYSTLSGVPLPRPYDGFDIDRALARPYRPFRWNYHQTMSLTKMEPDWWLELELSYITRIAQRQELYATHGKAILNYMPGSELACKELMEMVIQFLCARYPHYFSLSDDQKYFTNEILGTRDDLRMKHPLIVLLDNVPEDFAIMMRDDKTGVYFLRAGVICSALGWNLDTKMGLQLHQIHGEIPDYKEKMQFSMDRYFTKMPTDKPIQRGSWGLEVGTPLYKPPGDPHEQQRLCQAPTLSLSDCSLRVDWQTLRRLPLSGAVVFNFKALFTPLAELRDEAGVPALIAKVITEGKRELIVYKNTWHVEHVVLPALQEWAKEQVDNGLVKSDWQVATLEDSPWFRGWEEKWHRQQGF